MVQRSTFIFLFSTLTVLLCSCAHQPIAPLVSQPSQDLYQAAGKGDLVGLAKANDFQIKGSNQTGTTLLMVASRRNQVKSVDYLLSRQADAKAADLHKQTVLHYALPTHNEKIFSSLLNAGADPTVDDVFGVVPLVTWAEEDLYNTMLVALEHKDKWCCYARIKNEIHNILDAEVKHRKYIPPTLFLVMKDLE